MGTNLTPTMLSAVRTIAKFQRLNPGHQRSGNGLVGGTTGALISRGLLERSYVALLGTTYYKLTELGLQVACADAFERGRQEESNS